MRLRLRALACNRVNFLCCIVLPEAMAGWSPTSVRIKLMKTAARVAHHARATIFLPAGVAVAGPMEPAVLAASHRLRVPLSCP